MRKRRQPIKRNFIDKAVEAISPVRAVRRLRSRLVMDFMNKYEGASKVRRALKEWNPLGESPDADLLFDLDDLRNRSRDLYKNNPIAAGAIKTKVTNVVGAGLRLIPHVDREVLGMTEEQADAWEKHAEREWRLFWESKDCDIARTCNGHALTRQIYQQSLENGDVIVLLPRVKRQNFPCDIKIQVVEGDRLCNKDNVPDDEKLAGGVQKDDYGAPTHYHITKYHPGDFLNKLSQEWDIIPAFGEKTGLRNVIHLYKQTRPGQSRGVPDLTPVIEALKQLGRYTDAEVMAAVISGFFTVFIEQAEGGGEVDFDYNNIGGETGGKTGDDDIKMGNGLVVGLGPGEKVHDTNPGRPNSNFDPFIMSVLKYVGSALEIPIEVILKHFSTSFTAARAALNEFWKFVIAERRWLRDDLLILIYEVFMWDEVATGRIGAPGFFIDPAIRKAFLGCDYIGPARGQINETVEVRAAAERVNNGFSTRSIETANMNGGDWERNHEQLAKEQRKREEDGLTKDEKI